MVHPRPRVWFCVVEAVLAKLEYGTEPRHRRKAGEEGRPWQAAQVGWRPVRSLRDRQGQRGPDKSQAPRGVSRMVPGDKEEKAAEVSLVNQGRFFSILNRALPWLAFQP